jgi:hypothetical protein
LQKQTQIRQATQDESSSNASHSLWPPKMRRRRKSKYVGLLAVSHHAVAVWQDPVVVSWDPPRFAPTGGHIPSQGTGTDSN